MPGRLVVPPVVRTLIYKQVLKYLTLGTKISNFTHQKICRLVVPLFVRAATLISAQVYSVYLFYQYKSTNTGTHIRAESCKGQNVGGQGRDTVGVSANCRCALGISNQVYSVCVLDQYKSTNTDTQNSAQSLPKGFGTSFCLPRRRQYRFAPKPLR